MLGWGIMTMVLGVIRTPTELIVVRFLLGAFESGLFPGIVYCLTYWYKQDERAGRLALITGGATLGEHILHLRRLQLLKTSQYLVVGFGKKSLGSHILALRLSMAVTRYHDGLDGLFHHYTSYTISTRKAGS